MQPTRESNGAGRSFSPIWSCSAWGLPCRTNCSARGALLPHLFTLTAGRAAKRNQRRYIFCGTFRETRLSESPRPLAGMLPCGDRTFLPMGGLHRFSSDHPSDQAWFYFLRKPRAILLSFAEPLATAPVPSTIQTG